MTLQNPIIKSWLPVFVTAVLFYFAGKLTLSLSLPPSYATAIWPPAGIGLAAVLLWGYRVLPGIFIAELLIHYEIYDMSALLESPPELLVFFLNPVNSVFRSWLGCVLVKKFADYPHQLISIRLIILFFLLAGPVATFLPAVLSIYGLFLNGVIIEQDLVFSFLTWWLGDCMGIAIFTPLFFIIFDRAHRIWRQRLFSLGLPLTVMFLVVAVGYLFAQWQEADRLHKVIGRQMHIINDDLQNEFQRHLDILKRLSVLDKTMTKAGFRLFLLSALNQHPDLSRLEWLDARRDKNGYHYTSLYTVADKDSKAMDFDSVADLANKLDFGSETVTVMGKNEFLIFMPVIETGEKSCQCLKSLVAGIFNIKNFVKDTMRRESIEHVIINLLPDQGKQQASVPLSNKDQRVSDPLGLTTSTTIHLGGHKWFLQVAPDKEFLGENYSWTVWQLLVGGMFLTGFMSIGLLVLTGQNESIRSEVDKRTEELKLSHNKLSASEQQFRKLVQTQSAIVWRADPVTCRFLFVSDEAESILGYPVERWLNEVDFWPQHIHEDDRETAVAYCAEETRNHRNHSFEYRMITADGRCIWLRDYVHLTVDNDAVTEIFGFIIDITKQKQAEEQLRLAATTFESQQGIMITDKSYNILQVNQAFTEITGYSQEEVLGKNPRILASGLHDKAYFQNFWKQLTTNGRFEGEVLNRRKNGEIYPEWQTITAVKNDKGEVSHYVSVFSDITEKKETESRIHNMAFYDPLTKLPNRRLLLDRFDQELATAKRHKQFGAVIFLDLDHFKLLNDSQGHLVGDELLIQVANRLVSVLREEDTPARLGGDEFVVLLHANSGSSSKVADQAWVVAEKIKEKLNEPFMLNQYQHQISTSIGITLFPDNHKSPAVILQQADTAMYRSKASGRNAISFFHPSMQEAADLRLNLEQDLRAAIDNGRFILCYQPQVDAGGAVLSAEALIRWEHLDKGLLLPVDFIPVAEESSLILGIGRWVLLEACNQIKAWQDAGVNPPHISVNVSSRQFRQQDFVDQVKHAINSSQIAPNLLGIELTESVMIVDINDTIAKMKALKALGISIAVDDFGTGYSSLMYLKQLPIDALKIDQGFIRDILTDANDAVIVETIISMAQHLNLHVVAEGVETAEQLALLKQQGCTAFQGYYFSRPIPAAKYAEKYFNLFFEMPGQ
ncbi:MAG: EAL domain-containing protein [Methylococcaceae bacterium]|nr:EAL domain-containing protein [Methylococcaceae bacterium]